ncbi:MAG: S8 family serine peptidase, partial [Halorubrum sp.]
MGGQRSRRTKTVIVLVVACVLAAAVAPAAVAGGIGADGVDDTSGPDDAGGSGSTVATLDGDETADRDPIGPGLQSTNGTVELIVRFEADAGVGTNGAGGDDDATGAEDSAGLSTSGLKTNAASTQEEFAEFAAGDPAITVDRSFWLANAMLVTVDTDRVPVDRLLDVRGVERVHENFEVELDSTAVQDGAASSVAGPTAGDTDSATSTSTSTDATYGVDMVRAPAVWDEFGTRGEGATVAVIDTGIDPDHPDLNVSGWAEIDENGDVIQNDSGPYDSNGHGTHVAGTVAGGNTSGTAIGVAPETRVHAIKVFPDDSRSAEFARVIGGMEAALNESVVGERADVLQMSLGADGYATDTIEPVRNANDAGAIVVASSGNSGEGTSSSPGNVYDSLAVGAVDDSRTVADFSGGETVSTADDWGGDAPGDWPDQYVVPDVSAPGVRINSSVPGGGYDDTYSGTSMAAPHVSGVAALVLSATSREISDEELSDAIRDTANHPDDATEPDTRYGTGIVDAHAAVLSARPFYEITDLSSPAIAERNDTLEASANVTNVGGTVGENRTVRLRLTDPENGSDVRELNATNVSIGAGNTTTVRLNGTVPSDFGTGETTVEIASPEDEATATVRVAEAVGTVNGTVTDAETNATLSDIDVVVANNSETVGEAATGPDGTYAVDVPATNLTVTASNATYAPANETVELNGSEDSATANLSVSLRNGTLAGVVEASDGGDPPENATVTVSNETTETSATVAAVDADENGTYAVDLRPGSYNVTAEAPDFDPVAPTSVTIDPNATTDPGFELDPKPATIAGTVTNATDGEPIAGATVAVGSSSTDTGGDGSYSLAADRGERTVTAAADGYAETSQTFTLAANESREANASLDPKAVFEITSVSGPDEIEQGSSAEFAVEITNEGRAVGDVTVNAAVSPSGTVDPESRSVSNLGAGSTKSETFTVSVDDDASTGQYDVTASAGEDTRTRSFDVVSGGDDGSESTDSDGGDGGGRDGDGDETDPSSDDTDDDEDGDDEADEDGDEEADEDGDEEADEDGDEEA